MNLKGSETEKTFIKHLQENQEQIQNTRCMLNRQEKKDIDG